LREKLEDLSRPTKPRIPRDITRGAKRRNRAEKRRRALKKLFRRKPNVDR